MKVTLEKAYEEDTLSLFDMQRRAFLPLLEKYQDYETSPATEPIERFYSKISSRQNDFFKILADGMLAGGICVERKGDKRFRISPLFVLPEFQGLGIAQETIRLTELIFSEAELWELSTLLEEQGNCYLYEKMGYVKIGVNKKLTMWATLVYYQKAVST
ncbi:ribosomal protein S18 acetylase RimI-like enzyme [Planomicrobium soli]|uniref:Ribosomal protein S18 acetylase RimI-like enzyme n=1 Tax=Planomicrobium soli TaxID=1176648 RepID=A0A2P8H1R5_9BACL|nr:GNAT family N-acetyltransferase [Planomicrobium soli]PSL40163.1 ribosomal protein S18 acetylase RimI-like enzyme [Planomicrobium soli]